MVDRPIIFRAPMVKALLDGRKSQTRRLAWRFVGAGYSRDEDLTRKPSPWQRVQPGDRLWVREAWQYARKQYCTCPQPSEPSPCDDWHEGIGCRSDREGIVLRADGDQAPIWRPSIHMPRWASRLTLIVTATKIERLQDIGEADARAEGMVEIERPRFRMNGFGPPGTLQEDAYVAAREAFSALWDEIYGEDAWANNPEVIALAFRVIHANIDSAEARAA